MGEGFDFLLQMIGVPIIAISAIIAVAAVLARLFKMPGGSGGWGVDDE